MFRSSLIGVYCHFQQMFSFFISTRCCQWVIVVPTIVTFSKCSSLSFLPDVVSEWLLFQRLSLSANVQLYHFYQMLSEFKKMSRLSSLVREPLWLRIRITDWVERHVYPWIVVSVSYYYKDPIKRVGLVQREDHHFHEYVFSPWLSWKIVHMALEQQSLTDNIW
jgi:hypothetical protein